MEDRKTAPIYIDHVVQGEMLDLNIETIRFREKNQHYRHHAQLLYFYKTFFGDELNRRAKYREMNRAAINDAQTESEDKMSYPANLTTPTQRVAFRM